MRSLIFLVVALLAPLTLSAQAATDSARRAEVGEVVRGFHAALAAGDSLESVAYLHPRATIYESGHAETYDQYRSGHLRSDIAFARAVKREITQVDVEVHGDAALSTSEYHTAGQWRGREIDSHGTETMVLVRTPDGWRIRHIHWSSR